MKLLKDKILFEGLALSDHILKVDSFLNHQMDSQLMFEIGREFSQQFKDLHITKILTIEASGIAMACMAGYHMNVPVVFAKKHEALNLDKDVYSSEVFSYTKNKSYAIKVSKNYLNKDDIVLIIDDFLANGQAALGLTEIIEQAGAQTAGVGIVIEKGFQNGGKLLRDKGFNVKSLASIESLSNGVISFKE